MFEVSPARRYTPVGELIRYLIMKRLCQGPAPVEELDKIAEEAVRKAGVKYDWRVWPELLRKEVVVEGGLARLTPYGRWLFENTRDIVVEYLRRVFGQVVSN
ncbi:hypothetical protein Pogu_0615 [Pyrobaculum oguniense TE7]|uniref:Uncharacterized protein n=1 Tax=Pyrobaculum oguniense (strain DSM 13380 / JCM 10595 / TE7) TaxID=698757 RepID=H6Q7Y5_PYROT|nr:hypothetical protein Pogu_0615 [Pyrobaculum oguniense TE7]